MNILTVGMIVTVWVSYVNAMSRNGALFCQTVIPASVVEILVIFWTLAKHAPTPTIGVFP